tara:strand:+ start:2056 stop:2967 length:912 start_codon:yes stop_codon:yes gene_type:complete
MIKKNCLIIGFGSAGQRHYKVLKKNSSFEKFYVYSKKYYKGPLIKVLDLNKLEKLNLGYIIISSETSFHFNHLKKVSNLKNVKILIEKPIFDKVNNIAQFNNKNIFVGYNFRFNPIINFLKNYFKKNNSYICNIECGYYLPLWRKNNYKTSYSANKKRGGGVLLDLSHEIDYAQWIFQDLKIINRHINKITNLSINTEDVALMNFKAKKSNIVSIYLNYISKKLTRKIKIESEKNTILCDLIANTIKIIRNNKVKTIRWVRDPGYLNTYKLMHKKILTNDTKNVCKIEEAIKVLSIINELKNK